MSFRTSYSQSNLYKDCSQFWKFQYVDKLKSPVEGASLFFGSAIDAAAMEMVEGKPKVEYMNLFYSRMKTAVSFGKKKQVYDNPNIVYSYKDYDKDLLDNPVDVSKLESWRTELGLDTLGTDVFDCFSEIGKIKRNNYKTPTFDQLTYANRVSWLSLNRKGEILLQALYDQFLPLVEKVYATQHRSQVILNEHGDVISGFVDLIVKLKGYDLPVILDLKTSASAYTDAQLDMSEQLAIYAAMEGNKYSTNLVGYLVLCKNIPKDVVYGCANCSYIKSGKHRKCNNTNPSGARCNGVWKKLSMNIKQPEVQLMVTDKSIQEISGVLNDVDSITKCMKQRIVYKNLSKCHNWYGGQCPFFNACHKNDFSGLTPK